MQRPGLGYRLTDHIAAIDHDIVHASQELLYFFFVVFLVDFHLFPGSWLNYAVGGLLVTLALIRCAYYGLPYYLQGATKSLPAEQKLALVSAHRAGSKDEMQFILQSHLGLVSAHRIVELISDHTEKKLLKVIGLSSNG